MPRPPRLLPPPRISRPPPSAPLSFPTARSPPTIATTGKRPRSTSTRDYSSSSPGYPTHTPKLAWLAAEIKRLAYPPSSSSPPSPHAEPPYHHHPPQTNPYFPTPVFPLRGQDIHCLAEPPEFYEAILERIRAATSRVTLSALYLGTGEMVRFFWGGVDVGVGVGRAWLASFSIKVSSIGPSHLSTLTNQPHPSTIHPSKTGTPPCPRAHPGLPAPPGPKGARPPRPLPRPARRARQGLPLDAGAPLGGVPAAGRGKDFLDGSFFWGGGVGWA